MVVYREMCLGTPEMQDPPDPRDGCYHDVYLDEPVLWNPGTPRGLRIGYYL